MKMSRPILTAMLTLSLAVCGCVATSICNVSVGPTEGIVLHGINCAYPGLVKLPDGNLLSALACPGPLISVELSTDKGVTWAPNSAIPINGSEDSLTLLPNGTLFLSTSIQPQSGPGEPTYLIGTIGPGDSITWSGPVSVSTPGWTKGCWAVSPLVHLTNGDLLWPVWCYSDATGALPGSSTVLLSSDGGKTWPKQVVVGNASTDGRDYDESAAVVYPNGDIVMIIRHTNPGTTDRYGSYWRSMSTDNGDTWSPPTLVIDSTVVGRPTLALLPSGGLVLMSRFEDGGGGSMTGFATSWDEGLTFSSFTNLGIGAPYSDNYDAMALLQDGSIAVVTVHSNSGGKTNNIDYRNLVSRCSQPLLTADQASCFAFGWLK